MLQDKIKQYTEEINAFQATSAADVESYRLKFLVAKGIVKALFEEFKSVSVEEKRTLGKVLNEFKQLAEAKFAESQSLFNNDSTESTREKIDLTLPGEGFQLGSRHPLSLVRKEIVEIFKKLGFIVA